MPQPRILLPLFTVIALLASPGARGKPQENAPREEERREMVRRQIASRGVKNPRVLAAMLEVPRHEFVPKSESGQAYGDYPLPIGHGQTISQPYIVAVMTELVRPKPGDRVLEIGTGSGYQAAVLSRLVEKVYSIEIVAPLAERARKDLARLGYENVTVIHGDGYRGLPEEGPFDGIIVTAAPPRIPKPLLDQLKVGARMVLPVGDAFQELKVVERTAEGLRVEKVFDVRFVPMTGEVQKAPGRGTP